MAKIHTEDIDDSEALDVGEEWESGITDEENEQIDEEVADYIDEITEEES